MAAPSAAVLRALWPSWMSMTAPQSETTYPEKPHSFRSTLPSSSSLPQAGCPRKEL